jgi:histone H3/H4
VKTAALNEPTPRAKSEPLIETETESDDERATGRPSLSMPLEELEEDDSFQAPPTHRSTFSDPDQYTQRSVEVPRRASGEQLTSNLTRASLGTIRDIGSPGFGDTSRFSFQIGAPQGSQIPDDDDLEGNLAADETLGRFDKLAMRVGRFSDFRPLDFADQQEDTGFGFDIPDDGDLGVESSGRFGKTADKDDVTANPVFGAHDLDEEMEIQDSDAPVVSGSQKLQKAPKKAPKNKLSLPSGVVKKLASAFVRSAGSMKTKINKETLKSIMTASDWFFEQVGEDLAAYADHAGRKTIDDTDMILLMKRSDFRMRQISLH